MQRLIRRLGEQPERGASAIIVAICLLVLIGFTGFGIDVGSAYAKSQEVQNAADAAALATAQHCAEKEVECSDGSQAGPATELAQKNVRLQVEDVDAYDTYPASNRVTVRVTAEHQNYFAGVFGVDSFTVVRDATAQWDAPQSGPSMLPITISACNFYDAAGEPALGQRIAVWMPSGSVWDDFAEGKPGAPTCGTVDDEEGGKTYPPGGFGWLDDPDGDCRAEIDVDGWVDGDNGNNRPDCVKTAAQIYERLTVGDTFLLPIFIDITGKGSSAKFQIERFAAMKLVGYEFQGGGPKASKQEFCDAATFPGSSTHSKTCLNVEFVEWVEIDDEYLGGGDENEVAVIRLIDPEFEDSK